MQFPWGFAVAVGWQFERGGGHDGAGFWGQPPGNLSSRGFNRRVILVRGGGHRLCSRGFNRRVAAGNLHQAPLNQNINR
ncbi:MAG: hypothetical protein P7H58_17500 [Microcoleus anatoxicus]